MFGALLTSAKQGTLAYSVMMTARPETVGYGQTDSPVGLAAWILVHTGFARWTYGADPTQSPTKDDVLDDITLYWLTNSATSSARLYWENGARGSVIVAAAQKTAEISLPVMLGAHRSLPEGQPLHCARDGRVGAAAVRRLRAVSVPVAPKTFYWVRAGRGEQ